MIFFLFPLGNNINVFLNENWDELHKDVQPVIEKSLSAAYTDIASKLFSKVPFDEIFLPWRTGTTILN